MNMGDGQNITNEDIYKLIKGVIKTNEATKEEIKEEIRSIRADISQEVQILKQQNADLKQEINILKSRVLVAERKLRKYNIIIYGLKEEEGVLDVEIFLEIVNRKLELNCNFQDFRDLYRIGKTESDKPRPIVAEIVNHRLKIEILQNSKKLKGTGIFISQDYTPEDYKKQKVLVSYMKKAKANNYQAKIKNDVLIVNGDKFTYDDLVNGNKLTIEEREVETVNNVKETEYQLEEEKETPELTQKHIQLDEREAQTSSTTEIVTSQLSTNRNKRKVQPSIYENPVKRSSRLKNNNVVYFKDQ